MRRNALLAILFGLLLGACPRGASTLHLSGREEHGFLVAFQEEVPLEAAAAVYQERLAAAGLKHVSVSGHGNQELAIRVGGAPSREQVLPLVETRGLLQFHPVDEQCQVLAAAYEKLPESARAGLSLEAPEGLAPSVVGSSAALTEFVATAAPEGSLPPDRLILLERLEETPEAPGRWRAVVVLAPLNADRWVGEARALSGSDGRPALSLRLLPDAAQLLADHTRGHVGERLALVLDDQVLMSPVIKEAVTSGQVQLTLGSGTSSERRRLEMLAFLLNRPPLPARPLVKPL